MVTKIWIHSLCMLQTLHCLLYHMSQGNFLSNKLFQHRTLSNKTLKFNLCLDIYVVLPAVFKNWVIVFWFQNRTISHIPKCTCPISHNTPNWDKNMYFSVAKWYIVGYETGGLWDLWDFRIEHVTMLIITQLLYSDWSVQTISTRLKIKCGSQTSASTSQCYKSLLVCSPQG